MDTDREPWLPDLCRLPRVAAVLAVAQLVVLIIAVAPSTSQAWRWGEFVAASAFALWVALCSAILLCYLRKSLLRLPTLLGILCAIALPMVIAGFGAWAVQTIDLGLGYGFTLPEAQRTRFISSAMLITGLITAIALRYFFVRDQWQAQVRSHAQAAMDALQARIRPHFLFNSMNTIASLIRIDPLRAERAVEDLSDLFRASLGVSRKEIALAQELELCERYIAIETLRLGTRLRYAPQVDPQVDTNLQVPALILQPLLENAVVHGVARLAEGGTVRLHLTQADGRLRIQVENPSPPPREADAGNGHAQHSIRQRLAYRFGPASRMRSQWQDGHYRVDIEVPLA